ncbi:MAG: hypothetical protein HRU20_07010 [Pseudomonadales bacterium]|nr:hypothetical protein [Pseudomonadales bacterium]
MLYFRRLILIFAIFAISGCSYLIEKQSNKFAQQMTDTLLNFEDPATVGAAMPTFLIITDSIARAEDASGASQLSAAQIYGAYAGAFVVEAKRKKVLSNKAFSYARSGSCKSDKKWCGIRELTNPDFKNFSDKLNADDVEITYAYAVAWLSYIQTHSDDWGAIANLPKAKLLLESVILFDEGYDHAGAHLYLGAIATTLPPALGGKPDIGQQHFLRGIELSHGRNLLMQVEYARRYARLLFEQELHHQLLTDVLAADPIEPGLTLMNSWAQQQAKVLLADENEYFE